MTAKDAGLASAPHFLSCPCARVASQR